MVKFVIKRDGRIAPFDSQRIANVINKALKGATKFDETLSSNLFSETMNILKNKFGEEDKPKVEEIQDLLEFIFIKFGLYKVAKGFILYRKSREEVREEKKKILEKEYIDEVDKKFSINALRLLATRYLRKNEEGNLIENPKQLFLRVVMLMAIPEILYDQKVFTRSGNENEHPSEEIDLKNYENKIEIKKDDNSVPIFRLNIFHLERLKCLYDDLNSRGYMKFDFIIILNMLISGEFNHLYNTIKEYYDMVVEKKFMPCSPTLFNAGNKLGQLAACFVIPIEDNIESIMKCSTNSAMIFKTGGGIGTNYSKLRPRGSMVATTSGVASGPISFMRIMDVLTDVIKQGGKRRGANMGVLNIDHPDIEEFITVKSNEFFLENFNLSTMITKNFWEAYNKKEKYELVNPKNKKVSGELDANFMLETISRLAWASGDPGVLFLDNINERNIMKEYRGLINATNPCGEEPLYPYESCNLGSLNLYAFLKPKEGNKTNKKTTEFDFDWEEYKRTIKIATKFMDNVIDVNRYPIKEIEFNSKQTRKVGLGFMGLADVLYALKIPYNSEEGFAFMRKATEYLTYYSMESSTELSVLKGVFPQYQHSGYAKGEMPIEGFYRPNLWNLDWQSLFKKIRERGMRNAETTTIAPTGSISMIADVSSGLEPQFALSYEKRVPIGTFYYTDQELKRQLIEAELYNDATLKKIAESGGSLQDTDLPDSFKKIFVTAYDIPWWDHVRAQAEVTKWICAAVSKTINMPNKVTPEDVLKSYLFAYKMGCKGVTVYRDGSKTVQVLITKAHASGKHLTLVKNETLEIMKSFQIEPPSEIKEFLKEDYKLGVFEGKEGNIQQKKKEFSNPNPNPSLMTIQKPERDEMLDQSATARGLMKHQKEVCPECSSLRLIRESGCVRCIDCGWSECVVA